MRDLTPEELADEELMKKQDYASVHDGDDLFSNEE